MIEKPDFEFDESPIKINNLTQTQLLIWMGQKLNPESPLYNMILTFEMNSPIDIPHFQTAFQSLINKCDALRTIFIESDGQPIQKVLPSLIYELELLDWSEKIDTIFLYQQWKDKRIQKNLELSKILFDSVLIKFSEKRYIWYFNQHHLITDAWAVSILYKTMSDLYKKTKSGEPLQIVTFPSYQNYIDFEKNNQEDTTLYKIKSYWKDKLKKLPTNPRLYSYNGPNFNTDSKRISLNIGIDRSTKLRALAQHKDIRSLTLHMSLFNIFATILFAYIYRISGQLKLAVGTPSHNRATKAFKETPGVFIEVLPLMIEIEEDDSFITLFNRVRSEIHEFLKHAQPGTSNAELSRSYNVVLNYIHSSFSTFDDFPTKSEWVHPGHCDPRHHLRLQIHDFDDSGNIQLSFDLNCDVFSDFQCESVPIHFMNLIDAFISDATQPLKKPSIISELEYQQLAININQNGTRLKKEQSILDLFELGVEASPDDTALVYNETRISYQLLNKRSNQLAQLLIRRGVLSGHRVAVYLRRSPECIISILGIMKAKAAFILISRNNPVKRVNYILENSKASLLITDKKESDPSLGDIKIPVLRLDSEMELINQVEEIEPSYPVDLRSLAYIMYTSGSTGLPKGVMISHRALINYILFASKKYVSLQKPVFPLFTMIDFDLTITSIFVPLVTGGHLVIYKESKSATDFSLLKVIEDNSVDVIKLTPSHLNLLKGKSLKNSRIKTMIVGGEAFKSELANEVQSIFHSNLTIFNEYGPTEATVGCVVHKINPKSLSSKSVPIGRPIPNMQVYVLDDYRNLVPKGVIGELYVSGLGLADGYINNPKFNSSNFVPHPFEPDRKAYKTGDLVRFNHSGNLEFLERKDRQVQMGGIRIELGEIESTLSLHPDIKECVVVYRENKKNVINQKTKHCSSCGLSSNYPQAELDEFDVCQMCRSFDNYRQKTKKYFKTLDDLQAVLRSNKAKIQTTYDCIMLLSGGKDSTYALAKLVDMNLEVLAFTLDNGYISKQAKDNIRRVVKDLGVDHVFGQTPAMNAIFTDSLQRYSNVCNGCFKTLYTLSTKLALEKNIPYIVTGLSRGQFFETRLTEELFWKENVDIDHINKTILSARKAYHRTDDAVCQHLDVSMFEDDQTFEQVRYLDFYRYCDVSLSDLMAYLDNNLPWIRPSDTGRSTNCLINQVGIYVHKKKYGYSNYTFPYSWDVRLGHKTREAALDEINEEIDEPYVKKIMLEIGYHEPKNVPDEEKQLVVYYTAPNKISTSKLRKYMISRLPEYLAPSKYVHMLSLPLSTHGKLDLHALPNPDASLPDTIESNIPPGSEIEVMLVTIWQEVMQIQPIGINNKFLELGGNSLTAIRLITRINTAFDLDLSVSCIFDMPTISKLGKHIEQTILTMLDEIKESI
ncbi:MAG: amino acid adenylation domain-containing protein [Saprospiraceae bacterium]